ncbi:MAG: hypothetical protein LBW77_07040 [Verrucomicrobiota bacterium]|jgi:hypothetical protein|nr:hypothetical protein [Verrucomicrobiota bacterium]
MTEQQNGNDEQRQWFLRINGETVFGPVPTDGLVAWAEQGRVLPGHEVSSDRKKWVQAVSLELLDMRWYVDDGEGELRGPLNRLAAEALIKSGKVAEGAQLVAADDIEVEPAGKPPDAAPPRSEEPLLRRIRELEALVGEQRGQLAKLPNAAALETAQREREALGTLLKEAEAQKAAALNVAGKEAREFGRKQEQLQNRVKDLEQQLEEARSSGRRVAELEQAIQFHTRKTEETEQILSVREIELETARDRLKACEEKLALAGTDLEAEQARVKACEEKTAQAEARLAAAEKELTDLLNDANARDITYQEKIAELGKMCAQPPEETARFFADQAAVYELLSDEVTEISASLEREKQQAEQLKTWSAQRQQSMQERRQNLLKHLGGSPGEMTRRAVREQPSDPQLARLRAELESLRVSYQREVRLTERKEREWVDKVRALETESVRLQTQLAAGEKVARRLQELDALVQGREHELAVERRDREEEREQFESNQRVLLMRIDALERAAKPSTPEEVQSAEARTVKLASWMRLKR